MTEKNYNPEQGKAMTMNKQETAKVKAEVPKKENKETKVEEKNEKKKTIVKKEIVKKDEAIANGISVPVSTKDAVFICKFIKNKSIDKALADLDDVMHFKRAIPMTGEIPHRKGKGMMSGRYPIRAIEHFVILLKTLKANANVNGVEEPIIVEAVPNKASRPYGRFGAVKRKRTHIKIRVVEKNKLKTKKKGAKK
jgi:ribosomal protein L22